MTSFELQETLIKVQATYLFEDFALPPVYLLALAGITVAMH